MKPKRTTIFGLLFLVICLAASLFSTIIIVKNISTEIEDKGGVKQIIVNLGKEIKDIKEQINEE